MTHNMIVRYKKFQREYPLRFDILLNKCLMVEVKAVETVHPIHKAQLLRAPNITPVGRFKHGV